MNAHTWSEATKNEAARLWNDGYSVTQIIEAMQLPVSRNSVIGIAHRNRDLFHQKMRGSVGAKKPRGITKSQRPIYQPKRTLETVWSNIPKPPQPTFIEQLFDEPESLKLGIVEIDSGQCKWPTSGKDERFHMCGHETTTGKPYCAYHQIRSVGPGTKSERSAA